MQRLKRQYLQQQQIQGPLDKIGWLAHSRLHSVTENTTMTPLGKQEECLKEFLKVSAWAVSAMEKSRGPSCFRWRQIARQPELALVLASSCRQTRKPPRGALMRIVSGWSAITGSCGVSDNGWETA